MTTFSARLLSVSRDLYVYTFSRDIV